MAMLMLDVADAGAQLLDARPNNPHHQLTQIVLNTVVSPSTRGGRFDYTVRVKDQNNVEVTDRRSPRTGYPIEIAIQRTPQGTAGFPSSFGELDNTIDSVGYSGNYHSAVFSVRLNLEPDRFDRLEQRIATCGLPQRVFVEFVVQDGVWDTDKVSEIALSNSSLMWPLTPPVVNDGKPDSRPATRDQLRTAVKELVTLRRWVSAIFVLVLLLAIGRALFR